MNNVSPLLIAALFGATLGAFFFAGLWWTVQKGLTSNHPALWFLGSTLLRTALVLTGFFFHLCGRLEKTTGLPAWLFYCSHRRDTAHANLHERRPCV